MSADILNPDRGKIPPRAIVEALLSDDRATLQGLLASATRRDLYQLILSLAHRAAGAPPHRCPPAPVTLAIHTAWTGEPITYEPHNAWSLDEIAAHRRTLLDALDGYELTRTAPIRALNPATGDGPLTHDPDHDADDTRRTA